MVEEFDREIDSFLRQMARGEAALASANPSPPHLDADELAAFSENALPEKARLKYIAHLADCDHCRKILSNTIALNSEIQSEIIRAEEPRLLTASPEIPWYRRLFAVPTLAYAMGALVLLFAGIGVFTVLQNDSTSSQISQVPEKSIGGRGMSSDGDRATQESYPGSMSNTAASNTMSANTTANAANSASVAAPSAPSAANQNTTAARREPEQTSTADARQKDKSLIADDKLAENKNFSGTGAPLPAPPPPPPPVEAREQDAATLQPAPPEAEADRRPSPATKPNVARATPSAKTRGTDEAKKKELSEETTTVGGKTFKRAANVWVDAAYRGQATTNVSRGTNEYKNLDSGLRGIVENLGGTVVIVWKEKAYRIQ